MLSFCTPEAATSMMYLNIALGTIAGFLHILTHFNRLPGTVDWRDFVPFVSYARILFNSTAILTDRGYLYWKLYQVLYGTVVLVTLFAVYAYLPVCLAAINASS